jgi:hypothetical protein
VAPGGVRLHSPAVQIVWPARNRSIGPIDALGIVGLAGLLVARFIPVARLIPFWGCALRQRTGWPCLGCGLTRAADRFSHGDVVGALSANPLGTLAAAGFALCAAVAMVVHLAFGVPLPSVELAPGAKRKLLWVLGAALLLNYAFVVIQTRFPSVWS